MQEWLQQSISTFCFPDSEKPYVAIRPFVEKLGLDWDEERKSMLANDHWEYREEIQAGILHAGLPTTKVFIWLKSVDVMKVHEPLRRPLFEYQEQSRQMTQSAFLNSDLLAFARKKKPEDRSPLEQKIVEAGELLEQQKNT